MKEDESIIYPYIPNSVPEVKERMLKDVGAESVDEFYSDIPVELRLGEDLNLPEPFLRGSTHHEGSGPVVQECPLPPVEIPLRPRKPLTSPCR